MRYLDRFRSTVWQFLGFIIQVNEKKKLKPLLWKLGRTIPKQGTVMFEQFYVFRSDFSSCPTTSCLRFFPKQKIQPEFSHILRNVLKELPNWNSPTSWVILTYINFNLNRQTDKSNRLKPMQSKCMPS